MGRVRPGKPHRVLLHFSLHRAASVCPSASNMRGTVDGAVLVRWGCAGEMQGPGQPWDTASTQHVSAVALAVPSVTVQGRKWEGPKLVR